MFKLLFNYVREAVFLQRDVQQLKEHVVKLEGELHQTNEILRTVLFELQRVQEREVQERQKLELKLENILLRGSQSIPAPRRGKRKS